MDPPRLPGAVMFLCDRNAVRSPIAEAAAKRWYGRRIFVQSAGVAAGPAVDPFAVEVAAESGLDIAGHRPRGLAAMEAWGEDVGAYDLLVAMSPAAQRMALERARHTAVEVVYWRVLDPSGIGEHRDRRLAAYRETRDQIMQAVRRRFG